MTFAHVRAISIASPFHAFVVVAVLCVTVSTKAMAAITGQIEGTVLDEARRPIANVRVSAVSGSAVYRAVTGTGGRFVVIGVVPETYTISFEKAGFEPQSLTGITVTADATASASVVLSTSAPTTIARVRARSSSSAFQTGQTEDAYSFSGDALTTLLGKSFNTDQKALLSAVPSVTVDNKGGIFIRGGFAYQVGYQYEGIDYTEPSKALADQLSNVGNFDQLTGVASVQIIPGGGDATHGNTGTGLVVFGAKRGTFPPSGLVDAEVGVFPYYHQFGLEYGIGTRNNGLSNYFTYTGVRRDFQYGPVGAPGARLGYNFGYDPTQTPRFFSSTLDTIFNSSSSLYRSPNDQEQNVFLDNLVAKFGKNQNQSLQLFLQSQIVRQGLLYGGDVGAMPYFSSLKSTGGGSVAFDRFATYQKIVPLYPGQTDPNAIVGGRDAIYAPFTAYKLEYSNALNPTTYLTARYWRTFNDQVEDEPSIGVYVPADGGIRTTGAAELSKQVGANNFAEIGGSFGFTRPFGSRTYTGFYENSGQAASDPFFGFSVTNQLTLAPYTGQVASDFVTNADLARFGGTCPAVNDTRPGNSPPFPIVQLQCGYLAKYFPGAIPRLPALVLAPTVDQQQYSLFAQDRIDVGAKFRATLGVRLDGYNFLIPDDPANPQGIAAVRHQRLYEPHVGFAEQLSKNDSLRFTYGRTLSIPLASLVAFNIDRNQYAPFAGIPSYDNLTRRTATYCGLDHASRCRDYADQLYWAERTFVFGQGLQSLSAPLHGATYTNYDLSYAHDFGAGYALKITPFYRRGYDIVEAAQTVSGYDPITGLAQLGTPVYSNAGVQKATGVELFATRERPFGLSGSISATYINQLGNDVPGSALTQPTLALGDLFRSPNFSPFQATLAGTYRSHSGLRINPVQRINVGYPVGVGSVGAREINGRFENVPNTNLNFGASGAYYFVDPQAPGTYGRPNVVATRGTNEGAAAGSLLSRPRLRTDVTVELRAPGKPVTYGIAAFNLFDQQYGIPVANPFYHDVVSTGLTGPDNAYAPFVTGNSGRDPYLTFPLEEPRTIRFYVQAAL